MVKTTCETSITITGEDVLRFSLLCKYAGCDDKDTRLNQVQRETAILFAQQCNTNPAIWSPK